MERREEVVTVGAAVAPLHGEPRVSSPQVSQALAGHALRVLETREEWRRVRGDDDYEGWLHRGYLAVEPPPAAGLSLGCRVAVAGSERAYPLRARVPEGARVLAGEVVGEQERTARFPAEPAAVVASAGRYFAGTSYQWGGVTPWGADCSGLVQAVFALHGVRLPRDASQQALCGVAVDAAPTELAPADLLFFSDRDDRRVTHVGIATGEGGMVHLALGRGGWARERLDVADPYVVALRDRFVTARRIIGAGGVRA